VDFEIERSAVYRNTERLLRDYNGMQARLSNIDIDLDGIQSVVYETPEETIEGAYFARINDGGMPGSGTISDKTSSVALRWRQEAQDNADDLTQHIVNVRENLLAEKKKLSGLIAKIDNAIDSLSEDERTIIQGYYIEQLNWYEVAYKVQYSERHCKRLRTRAIWYISKSLYCYRVVG
jgi:hypothetical protein